MFFSDMSDSEYDDFGYEDYLDEDYYDDFDEQTYSEGSLEEPDSPPYMDKDRHRKQHCMKMVEGLNEDRRSGEMCDGIIEVDGREFPVHRVVLAVASPYFRAMFAGSFKESQLKRIDLQDVNKDAFEVALNCIYGEANQITEENISNVYECADFLCIDSVLTECKDYLRDHCFRMNDKMAAYYLAKRMELTTTMDAIIFHFHKDFDKIVNEPYFLEFPFDIVHELIEKKFSSSCVIEPAVRAIIRWVSHKFESRFEEAENLLMDICLDQITNTTTEELTLVLNRGLLTNENVAKSRDALIQKIKNNTQVVRKKLSDLEFKLRCLWRNQWDIEFAEFSHSTWDWTNRWSGVRIDLEHFFTDTFISTKEAKMMIQPLQAVAVAKDSAFLFGNATVLMYNFSDETIKSLSPLPKTRTDFCVIAHDDSLIVVGGSDADILRYDWYTCKWISICSWFSPKSNSGVIVNNGILYMVGGVHSKKTTPINYCISYHLTTRRFIRLPNMSLCVINPRLAAHGNMLCVFGQDVPKDFFTAIFMPKEVVLCQIYNIAKKSWSQSTAKISSNERILAVKTVDEGILVVCYRMEEGKNRNLTVSLFKPSENTMQYLACLPLPKEERIFESPYFSVEVS